MEPTNRLDNGDKGRIILALIFSGEWALAARMSASGRSFIQGIEKFLETPLTAQHTSFHRLHNLLRDQKIGEREFAERELVILPTVGITEPTTSQRRATQHGRRLGPKLEGSRGTKPLQRKYAHWTLDPKNRAKVLAAQKKAVESRKRNGKHKKIEARSRA